MGGERTEYFFATFGGTWTRFDYIVGVRLLLVQDDHCLADGLARGLREEGFAVQAILGHRARASAPAVPDARPSGEVPIGKSRRWT